MSTILLKRAPAIRTVSGIESNPLYTLMFHRIECAATLVALFMASMECERMGDSDA